MGKFFREKRYNRILSILLVCCLIAGTIGVNTLFAEAEETVYPVGVPTVTETFNTALNNQPVFEDVILDGVQQGVKMTFAANGYKRANSVYSKNKRTLSDGYRIDIKDFVMAENDAMLLVVGTNQEGNYIDSTTGTYGIVYDYDGDFIIASASSGVSLMSGYVVKAATKLAAQSEVNKLSIYVKGNGTTWDITVNTYKDDMKVGETYTTSIDATLTDAYFNFGTVKKVTVTDETTATIGGWSNVSEASYMVSYLGIPVQSVSLNKSELSLSQGSTDTLKATISPSTATDQTISWSSSNENCVTVDASGNVKALTMNTEPVTITAVAADGKTATCEVTVSSVIYPVGVPTVATGGFSSGTDVVGNGIHQGVKVSFAANGFGRANSKWAPRNLSDGYCIEIEDFAIAENNAMILVIGPTSSGDYIDSTTGTYGLIYEYDGDFVVMEAASGENLMSNGVVKAAKNLATQSEIDKLSICIKANGVKWDIAVDTYKDGVKVGDTYETSIDATLTNTYFNFGAVGYATITDTTTATITGWTNTSDASYLISYMAPAVTKVDLNTEFASVIVGETADLTAVVSPSGASQYVTWSSEDDTIATVNADGKVTALKVGTTVITATSKTNADITSSCVVKVTDPLERLKSENLGGTNKPTVEDTDAGVKVTYTTESGGWRRVETKYSTIPENNYPSKDNGFWPEGNGIHIGVQNIQLTNDTDNLAVFIGQRDTSGTYQSSWYDTNGGAYMLFYGKDGSFAIVEVAENSISKVFVSEKREILGDTLSLDVREEDGRYEIFVNGKVYSVPAEGDECPIPRNSSIDRLHFAFGLMVDFSVSESGVMTAPRILYSPNGTFTITDISYITTEELVVADYVQRTSLTNLDGNYILGEGKFAATTAFGATDFNGTLDDSCEDLVWEIVTVEGGYTIKKAGGDENSYLNISSTEATLGAAQVLTIERISDTTTSYFVISDGTNYLNIAETGMSVSDSPDKLILYNVRPELAEDTEEKPLFTLATLADLHAERKYDSEEEYIRDGVYQAVSGIKNQGADVVAFLGDLISNTYPDNSGSAWGSTPADRLPHWTQSLELMNAAANSATESGRAMMVAGNHDYAIGGLVFNSGDYTSGVESNLPELVDDENAYFQKEWPDETSEEIIANGHVLAYHYNIEGMDLIAINTPYTGTEITSGWAYDLDALDWVEAELAEIGADKTVFVLGHYPTSSLASGDNDTYVKVKEIFTKYPNIIYLYGHDHNPYIHTDTYQRVQTYKEDGTTAFQNRYEAPTGYTEAFAGSVAFTNDVGLDSEHTTGTPAVVQGLIVKVYSDRIVFQMQNYGDTPLGVDDLREYTIMRDVKLNPVAVNVQDYTDEFAGYRDEQAMEAPVAPVGYVFAGWYYDEACTEQVAADTKTVEEGKKIYAKFLPEDVLSVKAQLKLGEGVTTQSEEGITEMRLVTTVDCLDYANVGFVVNGVEYGSEHSFTSLMQAGFESTPDVFNACSNRFSTRNIENLRWNTTTKLVDRAIRVQAFWTTHDGTVVYGQERTITIKMGLDAIDSAASKEFSLR